MELLNIVFQIEENQHLSEERIVINYKDDELKSQVKIINISELSGDAKSAYETLKAYCL